MKNILVIVSLLFGASASGMNQTQAPVLQLIEPWGSPFLSNDNSCQAIGARLPMRCEELRKEGNPIATFVCDSLYERYGRQSLDFMITSLVCDPATGDIQYKFE